MQTCQFCVIREILSGIIRFIPDKICLSLVSCHLILEHCIPDLAQTEMMICVYYSSHLRNYTKLAILAFLYCSVVKSKVISAVGIEPWTLGLWQLSCSHSYAFPTELTSFPLIQSSFVKLTKPVTHANTW